MLTKSQAEAEPSEMEITAEAASLVYCSDADPGFRRLRAGNGFRYADAKGKTVTDARTLDRIKSLVIPPAWTDVWISPRADCHLQATGRDVKGRKQYRYHARWTESRDEVKYSNLVEFARALPDIRKRIDADLRKKGLPRDKVLATVAWLLDNAMIRVGNDSYVRENNSFGLTTLRDRHVEITGSAMRFTFRGKSGKEWQLRISDRRIARIVKGAQDIPGQHLFQYIDDEGGRRSIGSQDVNAYLREAAGPSFTSKHFRTWGGTVRAAVLLADVERPEAKTTAARELNGVIDKVANRLGNTRSVCRSCYVHPLVLSTWDEGQLGEEIAEVRSRFRKTPEWLDKDEAIALRWLESKAG